MRVTAAPLVILTCNYLAGVSGCMSVGGYQRCLVSIGCWSSSILLWTLGCGDICWSLNPFPFANLLLATCPNFYQELPHSMLDFVPSTSIVGG